MMVSLESPVEGLWVNTPVYSAISLSDNNHRRGPVSWYLLRLDNAIFH